MPDVSGSYVRGLLLAQEIVPSDYPGAATPLYREQSPIAGYAVPDRTTRLRLHVSGTPSATSTLNVRCQHAGLPGQVDHGAMMAMRRQGEPLWIGHEPPSAVSAWESISYDDAVAEREPAIVTTSTDAVVLVVRRGTDLLVTRRSTIGVWSAFATLFAGTSAAPPYWPALVVIGDEIFCLAWRLGWDAEHYGIMVCRSVDDGVTWELWQDWATVDTDIIYATVPYSAPIGLEYGIGRLSVAYYDGQVSVFAHLKRNTNVAGVHIDVIRQWAGLGLNARLDLIQTYQGSSQCSALPSVIATSAGFLVTWLQYSTGIVAATLGSASQPIGSAVQVDLSSYVSNALFGTGAGYSGWYTPAGTLVEVLPEIALCSVYDNGVPWVYWTGHMENLPAFACTSAYSPDNGYTWSDGHSTLGNAAIPSYYAGWHRPYDAPGTYAESHPYRFAACAQRGRVLLAHEWVADVSTFAGFSIGIAYLGGWTDFPLPYERTGMRLGHRAGYRWSWLPLELPEDQDYVTVSAGTSSSALVVNAGEHRITTGDGVVATGQQFYSYTAPAAYAGFCSGLAEWTERVDGGGSLAAADIALRLRVSEVNFGSEVEVRRTTTSFRLYDVAGGVTLATVNGLTPSQRLQFRLGLAINTETGANASVQLEYRVWDTSEVRRWIGVGRFVPDGSATGNPRIQWGHGLDAAGGDAPAMDDSFWREVQFTLPDMTNVTTTGDHHATAGKHATWHDLDQAGGDNPGKLPGRPVATTYDYLIDGFKVSGLRGPGAIGDTWTSVTTGEYALARAISRTCPSPRIGWRSVGLTADQEIPWAADPDNPWLEDCAHAPLVGVGAYGYNARRIRVDSRSAAGAWTTRYDAATFVLTAVEFSRLGNAIVPAGGAQTTWLKRDECAGWYVLLDNGAGTTRYRRVLGNDGGRWSAAGTEPMARLYLDGVATTDPVGGGAHRLSLWPDSAVVLFPGVSCAGWRIYLDNAYPTREDDFRVGNISFGPVHLFGLDYSLGRSIDQIPGHERVDLEGKIPVVVTRSPDSDVFGMSWDEGVYEAEIASASAVTWKRHSSNAGVGPNVAVAETAAALRGLLARHGGNPMVYVQVADYGASTTILLNRRDDHALVTCPGGLKIVNIAGNENRDEFRRVSLELVEVK